MVRDRRAVLADGRGDVFLLQVEFVGEPPVGERFVDRVQIFALDVFDQRHLEQRLLLPGRDVADDDRHAQQAGESGGAPAALAGDDLKPVAVRADDDRLDDAVRLDRLARAPAAARRRRWRAAGSRSA